MNKQELADAQMKAAMENSVVADHDSIKHTLDELRRTRAARGGVGAPLKVPANLADATPGIVITDADVNDALRPVANDNDK